MKTCQPTLSLEPFTPSPSPPTDATHDDRTGVLLPGCPAADALPWPDEVPVLTARDLLGWGEEPRPRKGPRPLWWWKLEVFPVGVSDAGDVLSEVFGDRLLAVMEERAGVPGMLGGSAWWFCTNKTFAQQAAAWNEAACRCGYNLDQSVCEDPGDGGSRRSKGGNRGA